MTEVLGTRTLLQDLAIVLCLAAVTTVVFRKLRQPVLLGYLLAGLIVGPHVPIPLFVDLDRIHTLSELGVLLVMFSVGLEFSVRRLIRVLPTSGIIGVIQISTMIWLGYLVGQAFGWTARECIFTGAIIAISSTMVVAKVFAEAGGGRRPTTVVSGVLADTVFGTLIVQDLAAVILLAMLTALSSTGISLDDAAPETSPTGVVVKTVAQLGAFLVAIIIAGFLFVPRAIRAVAKLKSPETLLITSIAVCFGLALLAQKAGYSVALGAFLAGSLVAESGEAQEIEHLIRPLRDVFAAIFFVAVGMILDPRALREHWLATIVLIVVVIVGQMVSASLGAFLSGRDLKTSVQVGMSLAQIGEFSFIIASVGVERKAIGDFLYPVAIAVAAVTTFTSPWLIRSSPRVAMLIDRKLPKPLQTFVSLYGSWLEQLRARSGGEEEEGGGGGGVGGGRFDETAATKSQTRMRIRSLLRRLTIDALLLAVILIAAAVSRTWVAEVLAQRFSIPETVGRGAALVLAAVLAGPFVLGIVRISRSLGALIAEAALPPPTATSTGKLDLAAAPRRLFVVTLQLGIVFLVGTPLLALTQPFIKPGFGFAILAAVVAVLGISFWRSATNLHDHVHAGAEVVLELLGKQTPGSASSSSSSAPSSLTPRLSLHEAQNLLPGLGPLTSIELVKGSNAIGKTLAEINLRALSGASVITILRGTEGLKTTGQETLQEGDVLALAGTREAIQSAVTILIGGGEKTEV